MEVQSSPSDELSARCLLCTRAHCNPPSSNNLTILAGEIGEERGGSSLVDSPLNVVFVIRNLLQVSSADCRRLVASHGNPSAWGTFCPQCSTLVRDAQYIAIIIKRSLTKLKCIQKRVLDKLLARSISRGPDCQNKSLGSEKRISNTQNIRHKLRNIINHRNKCKQRKAKGVKSIASEESAIHEEVDNDAISSSDPFDEVQPNNRPHKKCRQKPKKGDKPICKETPKCDICSKAFLNKIQLFNHRRVDHQVYELLPKTPTHICDQCGKTFTSSMRLKKHIQIVHQQIFKFTCTTCKRGHADKSSYDRHMLSHTTFKPYTCDVCGKGLTRSSDLMRHKRLHTGETPYKCDQYQCSESFTDASKVKKHMKIAHGKPAHVCSCGKMFYTFTQLRLHKIIHDPSHQQNAKRRRRSVNPSSNNPMVPSSSSSHVT